MNENILVPASPYETATALFETGRGSGSSLGSWAAHKPFTKRKHDKRSGNFFPVDSIRRNHSSLLRVETGALARPSRAQLGNCLRSQQLWVRYRLSNSLTVAMPVCGSRQSRTCVRTMCVCGIPDIHPQTFPP